eukprot:TRINITY_DN3066_c0_g3_i1.p1 TRINITY_DN3066_c0_g3~~TRINITY_DN3066_c0_g3_i1.p1  ORF type:complete len:400 (-),score=155.42 TRINITY_DN3066_c0_g3_i1:828-2027(-)
MGKEDDESSKIEADEHGANPFVLMDEIVEKLKLLDYESKFLKKNSSFALQRALHHAYFAIPHSNPNEQFFYLTSLISFLMGVCGHQWEAPQQFDDPNASSASIVENLQRMGVPTDFAPARLRNGHGETVCLVLMTLCDRALKTVGFRLSKPVNVKERSEDDDREDEDPEDDEVDDEALVDDEKEDEILEHMTPDRDFSKSLIESKIDPAEWRLEVERVSTQLASEKINDHKDWRSHLERMHQHQTVITDQLAATRSQLDKMTMEITQTLEKIDSREKFLNQHFKNEAAEYKAAKEADIDVHEKYSVNSETVTLLTNELSRVQDDLDKIKQRMVDASNQMSDTTPLLKIKAALERLRLEIARFDVRIGVVESSNLQQRITAKKLQAQKLVEAQSHAVKVK